MNEKVEQKQGLNYLSWAYAWGELKKRYPDAVYNIERFGEEKKPYLYDPELGYMVFTNMTICGLTHEMWLPVMDGANKAMKNKPYKYRVLRYDRNGKKIWNKEKNEWETAEKTVESATMFDINKTIMRCLVKNIGMFGLGLYIYAGEDLPEDNKPEENNTEELLKAVKVKVVEAEQLGVNFEDEKVIKYIQKYNGGKYKVEEMTEEELKKYIAVVNTLIQGKKEKAKD